jgi:ribosome-associated toxin RatA of RatAB toxin-antitoxin module
MSTAPLTQSYAARKHIPLSCLISADAATVYRLLAEVELWPAVFPHIASARVLRHHGGRRIVSVRASWRALPVGWRALQSCDAAAGAITFSHVNALSRGSSVAWTITPEGEGVRVGVSQQVRLHVPIIGCWLATHLLSRYIGPEMARVMLARLKEVAEGGSLAGRV